MDKTEEIKLTKQVYDSIPTKDSLDRDFIEFLPKRYQVEELFDIYHRLFYEIKLRGKNSHDFIVKKSSKYTGSPLNPLVIQIESLKEQILTLKDKIDSIEDEHPFIPNFKVIRNRNDGGLNYYIQSGRKRQINNDNVFTLLKKQAGFKTSDPNSDFVILLNAQAIGGISSGPPINNIEDLNIDIMEINRYGSGFGRILDDDFPYMENDNSNMNMGR